VAHGDNAAAPNGGAVYMFGTNGTLLMTFANPNPAYTSSGVATWGDFFGVSIAAIGDDRVLIGAPYDGAWFAAEMFRHVLVRRGGQGMLDLRCAFLSNRLDPFCQSRATTHAARDGGLLTLFFPTLRLET